MRFYQIIFDVVPATSEAFTIMILLPIDRSPCPVLLGIVSQLLPLAIFLDSWRQIFFERLKHTSATRRLISSSALYLPNCKTWKLTCRLIGGILRIRTAVTHLRFGWCPVQLNKFICFCCSPPSLQAYTTTALYHKLPLALWFTTSHYIHF